MSPLLGIGKTSQKTTSYLVDTDTSYSQVIEERAPDVSDTAGGPALQARYVWGGGLAPLAMWRKMPDGSVKLFFHLSDGQESVRQLTDASGAVVDSYFYDAWGNTLDGSSNHVVNPFRYTGQQLDADGKYYLRARFYNPGTGRFLSHDPLMGNDEDPASLHRYLYGEGESVNGSDPSGESWLGDVIVTLAIRTQLIAMGAAPIPSSLIAAGAVLFAAQAYDASLKGQLPDFLSDCAVAYQTTGVGFATPWTFSSAAATAEAEIVAPTEASGEANASARSFRELSEALKEYISKYKATETPESPINLEKHSFSALSVDGESTVGLGKNGAGEFDGSSNLNGYQSQFFRHSEGNATKPFLQSFKTYSGKFGTMVTTKLGGSGEVCPNCRSALPLIVQRLRLLGIYVHETETGSYYFVSRHGGFQEIPYSQVPPQYR